MYYEHTPSSDDVSNCPYCCQLNAILCHKQVPETRLLGTLLCQDYDAKYVVLRVIYIDTVCSSKYLLMSHPVYMTNTNHT